MAEDIFEQSFVTGRVETAIGAVPRVATDLVAADHLAGLGVRVGIRRMNYAVKPGLYCAGEPHSDSPVLVSANYKLSFDHLRRELGGISAWVLVLDTNGINVWCAAGKRTFGTDNLISAIQKSDLARVVSHRRVIVPQLGAPGMAAHLVKRATGFEVKYGPVLASDLPWYLANGQKATPEMRRKDFSLVDRLVLAPMEFIPAMKMALPLALGLALLLAVIAPEGFGAALAASAWKPGFVLLLSVAAATILGPALLPWLPGRMFAAKGVVLSLAVSLGGTALVWQAMPWTYWLGAVLLATGTGSFALMNFTGASTYTSLSGVKKEMRLFVPMQAAAALGGIALLVLARIWG